MSSSDTSIRWQRGASYFFLKHYNSFLTWLSKQLGFPFFFAISHFALLHQPSSPTISQVISKKALGNKKLQNGTETPKPLDTHIIYKNAKKDYHISTLKCYKTNLFCFVLTLITKVKHSICSHCTSRAFRGEQSDFGC